jgi:hypothetical protein
MDAPTFDAHVLGITALIAVALVTAGATLLWGMGGGLLAVGLLIFAMRWR